VIESTIITRVCPMHIPEESGAGRKKKAVDGEIGQNTLRGRGREEKEGSPQSVSVNRKNGVSRGGSECSSTAHEKVSLGEKIGSGNHNPNHPPQKTLRLVRRKQGSDATKENVVQKRWLLKRGKRMKINGTTKKGKSG